MKPFSTQLVLWNRMYLFKSNFIAHLFVEHAPTGQSDLLKGLGLSASASPPFVTRVTSTLGFGVGLPCWGRRSLEVVPPFPPHLLSGWQGVGECLFSALSWHGAPAQAQGLIG